MSKAMMKTIKRFYPKYWKIDQVKDAVKKGAITEDEYKQITGEDYSSNPIKDGE